MTTAALRNKARANYLLVLAVELRYPPVWLTFNTCGVCMLLWRWPREDVHLRRGVGEKRLEFELGRECELWSCSLTAVCRCLDDNDTQLNQRKRSRGLHVAVADGHVLRSYHGGVVLKSYDAAEAKKRLRGCYCYQYEWSACDRRVVFLLQTQ